jgi:putative glutamine amidotransferase
MSRLPLIGVAACTKQIGFHSYHAVGDKYVCAPVVGAGGLLLVVPALGDLRDLPALPANLDGRLFSRSPSSFESHQYRGPSNIPGTAHDPVRDTSSLPLIKAAIAAGVPVLGICPRHSVVCRVAGSSKSASPRTLSQAFGAACCKRASQR